MRQTTIVAVLDAPPRAAGVAAAASSADWLEVVSTSGAVDAGWLRARFDGLLLYTLRDRGPARTACLLRAAESFDLVDLTAEDLTPELLAAIPPERRVLSAHAETGDGLRAAAAAILTHPARLYRLTAHAADSGDELAAPELLRELGRDDVTAFATGPVGLWTRVLAPWLGARFVFGGAEEDDVPSGRPSVTRLIDSFGFPALPEVQELFGMVGQPVLHSLSPRIHNTAYRAFHHPALYLPFHVASFERFWSRVVQSGAIDRLGFPLRGLSVVSPHKTAAIAAAHRSSASVQHALSTNVFLRDDGDGWSAETTDVHGILFTLREHAVQFRHQRVAVIGCGGSGRAMASALHEAGADVTLVNRGPERGALARNLLHLPYVPLSAFACEGYGIVVNATPVGRDDEELPFPVSRLRRDATVVDLVYRDTPTPLIARTRGPGRITVDGWDMLMAQARHQFELMTGMEMPGELIRQTLGFAPAEAIAE
ncbi:MAG: 3-dehydroquinate dehydratase / shikimate dehydrogenase [Acidobacteriota bacterium]|jgi:3-dehydroquinate dehydratase/shikimate dehydrogenase|nr:3-dehydroquinate dehydratase / shikimate dehydrogenase [Acidobacteriota bacterium]